MSNEHVDITDPEVHEPRGASTASAGAVYRSDGAGSGTWSLLSDLIKNGNVVPLFTRVTDVSTADSYWVVSPIDGDIIAIYTVLNGAITGADAAVTAKLSGVTVTTSDITVAYTSSAAGDVDSSFPTALNAVTAGQAIEIVTDGASTGTMTLDVTIYLDVS